MTTHRIIVEIETDPRKDDYIIELDGSEETLKSYEPAPPKDWMPFCSTFCNVDFEKKKCSGTVVDGVLIDSCLECPYRKME